jgi:hypothetical protein
VRRRLVDGQVAGGRGSAYLPSGSDITADLERLAGTGVLAHWYEPVGGRLSEVSGSSFEARASQRFRLDPDANSSGFNDWLLILESCSTNSPEIRAGATL